VDLDVDLHPAPHVVRPDNIELLRPALSHDDLAEGADRVIAGLVRRLHGDPGDGPISLDARPPLRRERGFQGLPEEIDVGVDLVVRDLERPGLFRRHDRLLDLMGNLLRRPHGRVGNALQHRQSSVVSMLLDRRPRPLEEVLLAVALEEAPFDEGRDLADR